MSVKEIVGKIAKDYVEGIQKDLVSPEYRARHNYHVLGLRLESNPYPMNTGKRKDFDWEMHRLQTEELKLMLNGEENA